MGQRTAFSSGDVTKLNAMYKCNQANPTVGASNVPEKPVASAIASAIATITKPVQHRPNRPILNLVGSWFGKDEENEIETDDDKPVAS